MILYRPMVDGDVPAGLALCRAAGWNQTVEDWRTFLRLSPRGCCVAVDDEGQVRGTVATIRYGDRFSWIGMVLVDPMHQRQGIGIQLLRESLQILADEETIKLDATPAGRHIYLQLDFVDEYRISRMEIKNLADEVASPQSPSVRPMHENDFRGVVELDNQVFGANRETVLRSIRERAPQFAFVSGEKNEIDGYCLGRTGFSFTQIGPVVASNFETARNVVSAALNNSVGTPVVIDTLLHNPEWGRWLSSLGFTEQRPLIRMYRGTNAFPGIPEKQFAILGPEFG